MRQSSARTAALRSQRLVGATLGGLLLLAAVPAQLCDHLVGQLLERQQLVGQHVERQHVVGLLLELMTDVRARMG